MKKTALYFLLGVFVFYIGKVMGSYFGSYFFGGEFSSFQDELISTFTNWKDITAMTILGICTVLFFKYFVKKKDKE